MRADAHRRNEKINALVRDKRIELAKSHLRSRKQLEELLAKRTNTLETMQTVLLRLETAAGDIQIMQAYESATTTMKALLAHPSLKNADQTLDAMADALADQKEVEDAIGSAARADIDEDELSAELAALEIKELAPEVKAPVAEAERPIESAPETQPERIAELA